MAKKGKRTITVRVNGQEQDFAEKVVISNWQAAKDETASAAEKADEEGFEWVLPDEERIDIPEYKPVPIYTAGSQAITSFKRNKKSWLKGKGLLIVSAVFAIVIGLLLGLFILNITLPASKEIEASGGKLEEATAKPAPEKAAAMVAAGLPALDVALVQAGVFSTKEAGEEMAAAFKAKGQAASLLEMDGKFYLFSGVAADIVTAKAMENKLKAGGEDVWAKMLSFPAKEWEVQAGTDEALKSGREAFLSLAEVTGKAAVSGQLDSAGVEGAKIKAEAAAKAGDGNETAAALGKAINQAVEHSEAFGKSGNAQNLVSAQQSLLDYLQISFGTGPRP